MHSNSLTYIHSRLYGKFNCGIFRSKPPVKNGSGHKNKHIVEYYLSWKIENSVIVWIDLIYCLGLYFFQRISQETLTSAHTMRIGTSDVSKKNPQKIMKLEPEAINKLHSKNREQVKNFNILQFTCSYTINS